MGAEWKTFELGDCLNTVIDHRGKTPKKLGSDWVDEGIPTLSAKNVNGGKLVATDSIRKVTKDVYERWMNTGDVLRGDCFLVSEGATLGECMYWDEDYPVVLGQRLFCLRPKPEILDPKFLYFYMTSHEFQEEINGRATGTSVLGLRQTDVLKLRLNLPTIEAQRAIGSILYSLNKKIELNRRMNTTLEGMAQALFKSWFVDFDPVIDNALAAGNPIPEEFSERAQVRRQILEKNNGDSPIPDTAWRDSANPESEGTPQVTSEARNKLAPRAEVRKNALINSGEPSRTNSITQQGSVDHPTLSDPKSLFPAAFQETESMGWIPEGWETGKITDLADLNSESWSNKTHPDHVNYVDLANTKNGRINEVFPYDYSEAPSRARRALRVDDTISGTVRPGNRSFAYIHEDGLTGSTGFAVLRPKEEACRSYVYLCLTQDDVIDHFAHLADGGAYPAIRPEVVGNLDTVVFSKEILELFDQKAYPLIEKIGQHQRATDTLTKLRDTLLPKLISGELRMEDTERIFKLETKEISS